MNVTHTETIECRRLKRTCINMLSLQQSSHIMYFLDGCNSDGSTSNSSDWHLNLSVDELTDGISKACPCVYQQSD